MEMMGVRARFHIVSVFFKDLGFNKRAAGLPHVREQVINWEPTDSRNSCCREPARISPTRSQIGRARWWPFFGEGDQRKLNPEAPWS